MREGLLSLLKGVSDFTHSGPIEGILYDTSLDWNFTLRGLGIGQFINNKRIRRGLESTKVVIS